MRPMGVQHSGPRITIDDGEFSEVCRNYDRFVGRLIISEKVKFEKVELRLVGEPGKSFLKVQP